MRICIKFVETLYVTYVLVAEVYAHVISARFKEGVEGLHVWLENYIVCYHNSMLWNNVIFE